MNPIPGASVTVYSGMQQVATALTDGNGDYRIENLAPGSYTVVAAAPGFQPGTATVSITAGMDTEQNFQLEEEPGSVFGTVTNGCTNQPVSGALVLVTDGDTLLGFDVTDNSGNYIVGDLPPGDYTVTVIKQDFISASKSVTITSLGNTQFNFVLTPIAFPPESIKGEVIENRYLTQTEYVHKICWTPSPGECVVSYQIFRNGELIVTVPADQLKYLDRCRSKKEDSYSVRAVNALGEVSAPITITVG